MRSYLSVILSWLVALAPVGLHAQTKAQRDGANRTMYDRDREITLLCQRDFAHLREEDSLQLLLGRLDIDLHVVDYSDSLLKDKLLKDVRADLETLLPQYPKWAGLHITYGNTLYSLDKANAALAIKEYKTAQKRSKEPLFDVPYNTGCVLIETGHPAAAAPFFIKALGIDPADGRPRYNLGECYYKMEQADSAIRWFRKVLELEPANSKALYKIGAAYGKMKYNLDSAIVYISGALAADSTKSIYYEDLAVAFGISQRYDEAIHISERCLERFPDYIPAYQNLAISWRNKHDDKKADEYQQKADALREKKAK